MALSDAELVLFRSCQAARNGIIHLLTNPQIGEILQGSIVRVLLELQDRREDYLLARIAGVDEGEQYTGFSQNAQQSTNLHLRLSLPAQLSGNANQLYQLNSISNSPLSKEELEQWLGNHTANEQAELRNDLDGVAQRLRNNVPPPRNSSTRNNNPQPLQANNNNNVAPSLLSGSPMHLGKGGQDVLNATTNTNQPVVAVTNMHATRKQRAATTDKGEDLVPSKEQLRHVMLEELRQQHAIFAINHADQKISQLRLTERDLIEYLDRVREQIHRNRPNCVVCMDRIPTVIALPCKHRVLCRLCAAQCGRCPICRETATELFEAVEI